MASEKEIIGRCPHCKTNTKFREWTFTENLSSLGGFVGGFLSGGLSAKAKDASTLVSSFTDTREFPNYKCGSCGGEVMQCSECKKIILYEHDGTSHICGAADSEIHESSVAAETNGDVISKLERLGSLREKGLLTESEFAQQKSKLLG